MARTTPTTPDPDQIISAAADVLVAGNPLDDIARQQAAGHTAQRAVANGDTQLLDLLILAGDGRWRAALALLADMFFEDDSQPAAAPTSAFASLANAGTGATTSGSAAGPSRVRQLPARKRPATGGTNS